jgi:hypothetical protein
LLGLLLGFAFSGALGRFDTRRGLIVQDQPELRRLFREYLDARIRVSAAPTDDDATDRSIVAAEEVQRRIWAAAIESTRGDTSQNVARALIPAINDMIDITTVRTVALHTRMPNAILALLLIAALSSAMTAGYAMAKREHRSILHVLLYATSIAMTIYVVLDLEHPRRGLIRLEATEKILEQLRESIR